MIKEKVCFYSPASDIVVGKTREAGEAVNGLATSGDLNFGDVSH